MHIADLASSDFKMLCCDIMRKYKYALRISTCTVVHIHVRT